MMLRFKTMIDEDEYEMIDNGIGDYDNSFEPGLLGGSSQVDVSLSQTRINWEKVVDDTLVTNGTFYKQALPLFQEMMNSCSTKVTKTGFGSDEPLEGFLQPRYNLHYLLKIVEK